jgi:hypothetical protein
MKNIAVAGCCVIGAAIWLGAQAPAASSQAPQAPLSGLPPVEYSLGPESQPQPGVPKGTVTKHVLAPGKFYPGTPHNYQLYVPAQYNAGRPAPFMIFLAVDSLGYMWATSAMGIQVCEQPGRCTNILNKPEFNSIPITNIAFGGPDRAWLYVTQGGKLFRRETKRTGVVAWEPVKPPQPGLRVAKTCIASL